MLQLWNVTAPETHMKPAGSSQFIMWNTRLSWQQDRYKMTKGQAENISWKTNFLLLLLSEAVHLVCILWIFEFYNGRMSLSCIKLWHDNTSNKAPNGSGTEVRKMSICEPLTSPPATFQLSSLPLCSLRTEDDWDSSSDKVSSWLPLLKRKGFQVSSCP